MRSRLLCALIVAVLCLWNVTANGPGTFAVRDARIVPVSGAVIARGNIIVRDGLIEAVGNDLAIPPEARIIEGAGLTVYPGLIDTCSDIALPAAPAPAGRTGAAGPGRVAAVPQEAAARERISTAGAYVRAADIITSSRRIEEARNAGITSVLAIPPRAVWGGQSAVLNLGDDLNSMVVRSPLAMHIGWSAAGGFREFPGSLMGVVASISQTLNDARNNRDAWDLYLKNPRGLRRPRTDRTAEALRPVIEGRMPLVLPASSPAEIIRALAVAERNGVRIILQGLHQAHLALDTLKQKNVPLLVSLKFPERESDLPPDYEESLRQLRLRIEAPRVPGELQKEGLRFAFCSDGLSAARDFVRNAARTVQAGLPAEAALRALTLSAAEILGVEQQLGSLEKGKIANLVITQGDLLGERTRIRYVFVDGEKFDVPAPTEQRPAGESERERDRGRVDPTGRWEGTVETGRGPENFVLELSQEGSNLKGTIFSSSRSVTLELSEPSIESDEIRFIVNMPMGDRQVQVVFTGRIEGDSMTGTASIDRGQPRPFTATRRPR